MHFNKQTLLFALTALLFLAAGAATFLVFYKPTPSVLSAKINDYKGPTPFPTYYKTITAASKPDWETYTDAKLQFSFKHPKELIIDPRQTVKDKRTVFVFEEDKDKPLPKNVPSLFVVDTGNKNYDGLTVYKYADCQKPCKAKIEATQWIAINKSAYGIKNPNEKDILNYFVTDKDMKGSVINIYVGNVQDPKDKKIQEKIKAFEELVTTTTFTR